MQYRNLGRSGLKISTLGFGSWLTLGSTIEQKQSDAVVALAFERGINFFDTADVYNTGEGETALGRAIGTLPRHRLVVASKCFFPMSDDVNDRGLSRKHIMESVEKSLSRMQLDYFDLYQCHRHDPDTPLAETVLAMNDLIRQGKILYWGTSMWPAAWLAEATAFCHQHALSPPISNQPLYNLFDRAIEAEVFPTSARCGIGQVVYSPLAQGVLTGKYAPGGKPPAGSRATETSGGQFISRYMTDVRLQKAQEFAGLAAKHGIEPAVLALAWTLRGETVTSAIVGAKSSTQLTENLRAVECEISAELAAALDAMFPRTEASSDS